MVRAQWTRGSVEMPGWADRGADGVDDIIIGIILVAIGAAACLAGLRLWFALLPIWGFVAGFFLGATTVTEQCGDGFLSTVTGWVVGAVVGIVFALLSYMIWYFGAILAAASVGSLLGSGLMRAFSVDNEWVLFIVAAIVAVLFALAAMMIGLPVYVVIVNTAVAGAAGVTAGLMLLFNRIDLEQMENGATWAMIQESWFWVIVWAALAGIGMVTQLRSMVDVALPEDRWTRATPAAV
jgi:MFS family permease